MATSGVSRARPGDPEGRPGTESVPGPDTPVDAEPPGAGPKTAHAARGLVLAALGVVFGDIGTSPLYALQTVFAIDDGAVRPTPGDVYGVISLMFWSVTLIVSVKYVGVLMRADNDGEGGVMALAALAQRLYADRGRPTRWLLLIHQLPAKPAYLRVKVWRRLQAFGAVTVKNSVYVLPAGVPCALPRPPRSAVRRRSRRRSR